MPYCDSVCLRLQITGIKKFKGCLACMGWVQDCCPIIEDRKLVMKHRFVGVSLQKRSHCCGICCCCRLDTLFFTLKESSSAVEENELVFPIADRLSPEDMSAIFDFVYGDVNKSGHTGNAHSLAILTHDGIICKPESWLEGKKPDAMER